MKCRDLGDERIFHCSECGYVIEDFSTWNDKCLAIGDNDNQEVAEFKFQLMLDLTTINYCPHCGRKIEWNE